MAWPQTEEVENDDLDMPQRKVRRSKSPAHEPPVKVMHQFNPLDVFSQKDTCQSLGLTFKKKSAPASQVIGDRRLDHVRLQLE